MAHGLYEVTAGVGPSDPPVPLLPVPGLTPAPALESDALAPASLAQTLAYARELSALYVASRSQLAALRHQATHDALTGLPNRTLLLDRLAERISGPDDSRVPLPAAGLALLVINLDHFQEINATLGHQHGDQILREVGARLGAELSDAATVARLGGDEFAILAAGGSEAAATGAARRVQHALQPPFLSQGLALDIRASIGIALYPEHGAQGEDLLRRADVALRLAKQTKDHYVVYDPAYDRHTPLRLALAGELCGAIERRELLLDYQPQVSCRTHRLEGVEALIRWQHPVRGRIQPSDFIPLSERTGLIKSITLWGLRAATQQWRAWHDRGLRCQVAVNLSARCLNDPALATALEALVQESGMPPTALELELTESAVMADPVRAREILSCLHERGFRLAIDDFGTGYSSLAYLKDLPVDTVKLDKCFVKPMSRSPKDAALVRCAIDLGHQLGLRVVAEGVEDQATWDLLIEHGCDAGQGWFLGYPVPPVDIPTLASGRYPLSSQSA